MTFLKRRSEVMLKWWEVRGRVDESGCAFETTILYHRSSYGCEHSYDHVQFSNPV